MLTMLIIYLGFVILLCLILGFYILSTKKEIRPLKLICKTSLLFVLPLFALYTISIFFPIPEVSVPNLIGLERNEAQAELESAGLSPRVIEEAYQGPVGENIILSQKPEAGSLVKKGRKVTLVVSTGRKKVIVPNLIGRPFSQIKIVLEEDGLLVGNKKEEPSSEYGAGTIISQTPSPGEEAEIGTPIAVSVAVPTQEGEVEE